MDSIALSRDHSISTDASFEFRKKPQILETRMLNEKILPSVNFAHMQNSGKIVRPNK